MAKQVKLTLLDGAGIDKTIVSIAKRGKAMDNDIHLVACSIVAHIEKHGDITKVEKLVNAMPQASRKSALKDWFLVMAKVSYDMKNKAFVFDKAKVTMQEDAEATPFWEFKPEPEYKPFDIQASINAIIAKATKAMERGEKVPEATVEALRKLATVEPSF